MVYNCLIELKGAVHMEGWRRMALLNKEEVKYCVKKILDKQSFTTKSDLLGNLHHVTITRYMRHYKDENPMIDRVYQLNGKKSVNVHNSEILNELIKEGFVTYDKVNGKYHRKGKIYEHHILKVSN